MGMYDTVVFEDGIDVEFPPLDTDPTTLEWQTKTFPRPFLREHKVTSDKRLLREDVEYEAVPEEERPGYDEELGGFEKDFHKAWGMMNKVTHGWNDTEHHGIVEIHTSIEDELVSLDLKFTDGRLVEITQNK